MTTIGSKTLTARINVDKLLFLKPIFDYFFSFQVILNRQIELRCVHNYGGRPCQEEHGIKIQMSHRSSPCPVAWGHGVTIGRANPIVNRSSYVSSFSYLYLSFKGGLNRMLNNPLPSLAHR